MKKASKMKNKKTLEKRWVVKKGGNKIHTLAETPIELTDADRLKSLNFWQWTDVKQNNITGTFHVT